MRLQSGTVHHRSSNCGLQYPCRRTQLPRPSSCTEARKQRYCWWRCWSLLDMSRKHHLWQRPKDIEGPQTQVCTDIDLCCAFGMSIFCSIQEWPIQMAIGYAWNVAFFKWKEPNRAAAITSPHRTYEIVALRALQLTRFPRDFTAARRTVQGNTENAWRQRCNKTSTAFWKLVPLKPSSIVQAPTLKQRNFFDVHTSAWSRHAFSTDL